MLLYSLSEDELRGRCKKKVESLEYWLRRIIHEKFTKEYGAEYFTKKLENDENVIKGEISKKARARREAQPSRYSRDIDATLLDDLITILCNKKNYSPFFKDAFHYVAPLGEEHLRYILNKIWECRNPLSHANPISVRQGEQLLCYCNDIIDSLKEYYRELGVSAMYNVPTFLKMVDSFGNAIYRDAMTKTSSDTAIVDFHENPSFYFRPSDTYSVELEIDPSFDDSLYMLRWNINHGEINETGNKITLNIENKHVTSVLMIVCKLTTKNEWHKCGTYDDEFCLLLKVLPPI